MGGGAPLPQTHVPFVPLPEVITYMLVYMGAIPLPQTHVDYDDYDDQWVVALPCLKLMSPLCHFLR